MMMKYLIILLTLTFIVSACKPVAMPETMMEKPTAVMEKPPEEMMEKPADQMMSDNTPVSEAVVMSHDATATPEGMMDEKMMSSPTWFGATLTNVRTGENFSINDFKGKVVLVETLAMWCPNCKKQQLQLQALHEMLGTMSENLITIGLDIDPNENATDLKSYTEANGFDWVYAVAPADVTREIGQLYGDQFLNPSSTPILVIDHVGEVQLLPFGVKSSDELKMYIDSYLSEGM